MNLGKYYYNQNDYSNVPYDNKTTPNKKETIKSSGCGVCSAAMVINNMYQQEVVTISELAKISIDCGARGSNGTVMTTLLTKLCKEYKLIKYRTTEYTDELMKHLNNGGVAILHQGDVKSTSAIDVFSSGGHYVYAYKAEDDNIYVYDPAYTANRYTGSRKNKIVRRIYGKGVVVNKEKVKKATSKISYYLISYNGTYKDPCKWIKPNAITIDNTDVFANNDGDIKIGSLKGRREVEILMSQPTWCIIRFGTDTKKYKVGLVKTANLLTL